MPRSKSRKFQFSTVGTLNIIEKPSVPIGTIGDYRIAERLALRLLDKDLQERVKNESPCDWLERAYAYSLWAVDIAAGRLPKFKAGDQFKHVLTQSYEDCIAESNDFARWSKQLMFAFEIYSDSFRGSRKSTRKVAEFQN